MRFRALVLALVAPVAAGAQEVVDVRVAGAWRTVWSGAAAPSRWTAAHPLLDSAITWVPVSRGVHEAHLDLRTAERGRYVRVTLVRLDPARISLALHANVGEDGLLPWSLDAAPPDARVAVNGGQFSGDQPWGWVVHRGREIQPPGDGPLSMALVVSGTGRVAMVTPGELPTVRGEAREALQSYPALLVGDGEVPAEVLGTRQGIDTRHRDTRLALGIARDGAVILALTRMQFFGVEVGPTPLGLTVGETAALMGALGARRAMMLDGGLSSQLLVRHDAGGATVRRGLRRVPLGIVAR